MPTIKRLFFKIIGLLNRRPSTQITYQGVFENFSQVKNENQIIAGYTNRTYLENESEKIDEMINQRSTHHGNYRDRDLLLILASIASKQIRVVDLGSGFGLTYLFLTSNLRKNFEYVALELDEVVEILQKKYAKFGNFRAITYSQLPNEEFELAYFGSSLQYFENYIEILSCVAKSNPSYIIISDTPMGNLKSFVTAQVNMKNRIIPRWIFSFEEIKTLMEALGYKLNGKSVVDWHQEFHNFNNFPEEYHHIKHFNLVFIKE